MSPGTIRTVPGPSRDVELGSSPTEFEPHGTHVATWLGPGEFSAFRDIFEKDFLTWRIKPMARPGEREPWLYVFGCTGGANIYDNDGESIAIHWLRSRDGLAWEPVVPGQSVVLEGGAQRGGRRERVRVEVLPGARGGSRALVVRVRQAQIRLAARLPTRAAGAARSGRVSQSVGATCRRPARTTSG